MRCRWTCLDGLVRGQIAHPRADAVKVNEALAKLVCHNLCCVIMSQSELGIESVFWQNEEQAESDEPAILRMVRPG